MIAIPGQLPLPHQRPKGCNFGPRCGYFVEGLCDQADVPMRDVAGASGRQSRCLRVEAIDWAAAEAGRRGIALEVAGWSFLLGSLVFSGSLYVLAATGLKWLGMITPLGGIVMLVAWLALAAAAGASRGA